MKKTIEQIKEEEAKNHGWGNYNRALDAANAGVISGFSFADLWEYVAIQYASQFQTNDDLITTEICVLRERVAELEGCLEEIIECQYNPQKTLGALNQAIFNSKELINKCK